MKLWIDDVRPAPEGYVWCKSVNEAKRVIVDPHIQHCYKIEFIDNKDQLTEKTVSQVISGAELFVPLGELVDMEKELIRLKGELDNIESEIKRASGKLANNGFLDKAPKALVDAERAKLDKFLDMRNKLKKQIKDLDV